MAGALVGADVEQLRRLANQLRRSADDLTGSERKLRSLVESSPWHGANAVRFRQDWTSSSAAMTAAARSLTAAAADVERNAREQEQASSASGGAGPGLGGPSGPNPPPTDPALDQILRDYQVVDDEMVMWEPTGLVGFFAGLAEDVGYAEEEVEPRLMTRTEADLLNNFGLLPLKRFKEIADQAFADSEEYYPGESDYDSNDGHQDALRHAYWNAMLTREFGADFAERFTTAHEGNPENTAGAREAMDLYNNELGRQIAIDNPDASDEELAELVYQAVERGDAVVVAPDGVSLRYSDEVAFGEHGAATPLPVEGRIDPEGARSEEENPATS